MRKRGNPRAFSKGDHEVSIGEPPAYPDAPSRRCCMSRVRDLERRVRELMPEELVRFRQWFIDFDAQAWDRQFEADIEAGKLDALAEKALRAHAAGQTTKL